MPNSGIIKKPEGEILEIIEYKNPPPRTPENKSQGNSLEELARAHLQFFKMF